MLSTLTVTLTVQTLKTAQKEIAQTMNYMMRIHDKKNG